jgi:threonine aldolase
MREAMANAELGDDVYGEDPTLNRLEALAADMLGKEAAIFAPSGTQSNLLALFAHCQRGDEYIVGQTAHTYKYEGGGAAVLGSIQPQPLDFEDDATLDLDKVAAAVKADDFHFAKTRLLCLENTQGGRVLPLDYLARAREFVDERGLALHLDGARVFNAAVKQAVPVIEIARYFDTVSVCLSKGLGSPVGSVLCGSKALIEAARRWRKVLGGGMRQAGVLAAAGIYALHNNIARLAEDHANARRIADGLRGVDGLGVDYGSAQTNMVFVEVDSQRLDKLVAGLANRGIVVTAGRRMRLVTHLDVTAEDIDRVIEAFESTLHREAVA